MTEPDSNSLKSSAEQSVHRRRALEASRGERASIDWLMDRHLPGLLLYVRLNAGHALRTRESSMDLVQSACREVLKDIDSAVELSEAHFKCWLYAAAERKIKDRARFHAREKRAAGREISFEDCMSKADADLAWRGCASFITPSHAADAREELARLEASFRQLSKDHRDVILQSRIFGYSHAEIAARCGRTEGAVRVLLHRALARLARLTSAAGSADAQQ
ncbi:MAG: sigma-70 family RNA polymerase sigma factor [Planctomycetes bacterium]|nr:sigma-70 family RNA polymerase sigma factor [Planctomycetota bacterium]